MSSNETDPSYGMMIGAGEAKDQFGNTYIALTLGHGAVSTTIGIPFGKEEEFTGEVTRVIRTTARRIRRQGLTVIGDTGDN